MDPARGLAQAVADLADLALQQVDLARNRADVRLGQPAAGCAGGVHAPLGKELGRVQARAGAFGQQKLGHVEADAPGPDERHRLAHRLLVAQHLQVTQHLGVANALDVRCARVDARGQHHMFVATAHQVLGADLAAQLQLHAGQLDLLAEIAQRLEKLFLARHLLGHVELAADLIGGVDQRHVEAAAGGFRRERQPGRPRTHHRDALFLCQGPGHQQRLMTGARVHQAGRDLAAEGVVQAGLVAADAGVDLIGLAGGGLGHELGVGQEGARHAHYVGVALGQHGFGHVGRVDAVGGH